MCPSYITVRQVTITYNLNLLLKDNFETLYNFIWYKIRRENIYGPIFFSGTSGFVPWKYSSKKFIELYDKTVTTMTQLYLVEANAFGYYDILYSSGFYASLFAVKKIRWISSWNIASISITMDSSIFVISIISLFRTSGLMGN